MAKKTELVKAIVLQIINLRTSLTDASAGIPNLVYGGYEDQVRSGVQVVSWKNLPALLENMG